ncbi:hypothetical protein CCMA1212_008238 [Trichoderma ghanense]|uniref:Uncharacterized protein n=1 Tax=Trichoderma ghanense TaxID=65468 RepID=A0ABY2GWN8_9HYPO
MMLELAERPGLEQANRWAVDLMEIPSDEAPGISNWRQGGSCGGNCVGEPRITETQGIASLDERFRLVVQALTDPPVPRTFCSRFTLLELASGKEEGQGLARDFGRAFGDEVELHLGPISSPWERHGGLVQIVDGSNFTPLSRATLTLRVKSSRPFRLALEALSSCAPGVVFLHLLFCSLRILIGQSCLSPSISVVSEAKRRLSLVEPLPHSSRGA